MERRLRNTLIIIIIIIVIIIIFQPPDWGARCFSGGVAFSFPVQFRQDLTYAPYTEAGTLTNLPLWSRRTNHRACSAKMPPLQSYKRRRVACQHFPDDQTLRLQAGAGEDDVIHLPSGLDRVDCERQEEEEDEDVWNRSLAFEGCISLSPASLGDFIFCCLLLGPFPQSSVAGGLRRWDPKDSSKAGVDGCLELLHCHSRGSTCFSSIQQHRFYCGV